MESDEDNGQDSKEPIDWGLTFMILKGRGFTHDEILKLSYPQLNAYMSNISQIKKDCRKSSFFSQFIFRILICCVIILLNSYKIIIQNAKNYFVFWIIN